MNEEFEKVWDKIHDAFNSRQEFEFSNIADDDRLHPNRAICGMMKVASLLKKGPTSFEPHSEHDILYLCPVDELKDLTGQDIAYLIRCGVHYDRREGSLAMFN